MLASLTALLPRRARRVLVDGPAAQADLRTAKLAPRKRPVLARAEPDAPGVDGGQRLEADRL